MGSLGERIRHCSDWRSGDATCAVQRTPPGVNVRMTLGGTKSTKALHGYLYASEANLGSQCEGTSIRTTHVHNMN